MWCRLGRSSIGPTKPRGGKRRTARRLPPPCCSPSRSRLEARPMLWKAPSAKPLVAERGRNPTGDGREWTSVVPTARCGGARGEIAQPSAVRESVPLPAGASHEATRAQWLISDIFCSNHAVVFATQPRGAPEAQGSNGRRTTYGKVRKGTRRLRKLASPRTPNRTLPSSPRRHPRTL